MKVKWDFVTNSSSCCYLISIKQEVTEETFNRPGYPISFNHFTFIRTIEHLIEYADCSYSVQKECDWVRKITGPIRFHGMQKEWYDVARKEMDKGNFIVVVDVERHYDDVEYFDAELITFDCEVLKREYD